MNKIEVFIIHKRYSPNHQYKIKDYRNCLQGSCYKRTGYFFTEKEFKKLLKSKHIKL